jgi:hypothetical protein
MDRTLSSVEAALDSVLDVVTQDLSKEADWLELLAQLEYIGCRKILRAIPFDHVDADVLRHVADEAAHASVLKQAAEQVRAAAGDIRERSWGELPLAAHGWEYFRELDRRVSTLESVQDMSYPAVSWAVEQRALWVYPRYLERTGNEAVRRAVRMILAQEERHNRHFEAVSLSPEARAEAADVEAALWTELVTKVRETLVGGPSAAIHFPKTDGEDIRATD